MSAVREDIEPDERENSDTEEGEKKEPEAEENASGIIIRRRTFGFVVKGDIPNRGLFTKEVISAGSRIIFEQACPAGYCLDVDKWDRYCQFCCTSPPTLLRCKACKKALYCDRNCQIQHWEVHKSECPLIALLLTKENPAPELLRDILMIRRAIFNPTVKEVLGNMCVTPLPFIDPIFVQISKKCQLQLPGLEDVPVMDMVNILRQFQSNSFSLLGELNHPIGHGIFAFASLVNHSCDPNLAIAHIFITGQRPVQLFVAQRRIEIDEELTHCYVNQLEPKQLRQKALYDRYGFDCRCRRCLCPLPVDQNYVTFSPERLSVTPDDSDLPLSTGLLEMDRLENILQNVPHWSLRNRLHQFFSLCITKKQYKAALVCLNKIVSYDRLILSEFHPSFQIHERFRVFLTENIATMDIV